MKRNALLYYAHGFLTCFELFVPYLVIYFLSLGFSLTQVAILNAVLWILVTVLEVPSGRFADTYGRKPSLIISSIAFFLATFTLWQFTSFFGLLVSHVFFGLGMAFLSGAGSALIYDSLLFTGRTSHYKKVEGRYKFAQEVAVFIASLLGGLLIVFGYKFLIGISLVPFFLAIVVSLFFKEPNHVKRVVTDNMYRTFKKSLDNKKLKRLFIYFFFIYGFVNAGYFLYQPFFQTIGIPLPMFGVIFALLSIPTALAAYYSHEIEMKLGARKMLLYMPLFLIISFFGAGIFFFWVAIILFFLREIVRGLIHPVLNDYVNKHVIHERATILSIASFFARIGQAVIVFVVSVLYDLVGLRITFFIAGGMIIVWMLFDKAYKD